MGTTIRLDHIRGVLRGGYRRQCVLRLVLRKPSEKFGHVRFNRAGAIVTVALLIFPKIPLTLAAATKPVKVYLCPARFPLTGNAVSMEARHQALWTKLADGLAGFEATKRPPDVRVDPKTATYIVK